ncbi:SapC family protein [Aquicoccus sp.]|uniref:SapC family protein n=1 Tax=Aquicoccus sp. TaxID=2055851 RepID=UPI0035647D42
MTESDHPGGDVTTTSPVPVSPERHGGRFWRRFTSWAFAARQRLVPIVLGEHEQVAASLPFFFLRTQSQVWPVALSRLRVDGRCALVSPRGAWRGSYVPSILRVHPFSARRTDDGSLALLVDEAGGFVSDDPADEPFFNEDGTPTAAIQQVIGFFRERAAAEARTREAMSEIAARNLLIPFEPPPGLAHMDSQGLWLPDRARIDTLRRADLSALHRCGALALLHVQAVSLHHLPLLAAAEAQPDRPASPVAPDLPTAAQDRPGPAQEAALSGFFDALAASQERETDLPTREEEEKPDQDGPPGPSRG